MYYMDYNTVWVGTSEQILQTRDRRNCLFYFNYSIVCGFLLVPYLSKKKKDELISF